MKLRSRQRRDPDRHDVVIGIAALALIAIVGYVAYHALSGLPFERRYHVTVHVPNANRLIDTDEVRIRGVRVGQVGAVSAEPGDPPSARVELVLDRSVGRLPVDTGVRIRPASVLGASYVDLRPGTSRRTVPEGGALPLARARGGVELTDLFDTFDRSARASFQRGVRGLSGGLAGRGRDLNATIGSLRRLAAPLERVMAAAGSPRARLGALLDAANRFTRALALEDAGLGRLVTGGAATMAALARERDALDATLRALPGAEAAATDALVRAQPALEGVARLAVDLDPASLLLRGAAERGTGALVAGIAPLRDLPALTEPLRSTLSTLRTVSRRRSTSGVLRKLQPLTDHANAFLGELVPAQLQCNVIPLGTMGFGGFIGGVGTGDGPSFWNLAISTKGAQTDAMQAAEPAPDLKVNYLPNNNADECESGNEPAVPGQALDNPPGLQADRTRATTPPPGVRERAVDAGLIEEDER